MRWSYFDFNVTPSLTDQLILFHAIISILTFTVRALTRLKSNELLEVCNVFILTNIPGEKQCY
jgi:hypothetical protein